jgi:hypothetical protein
MGQKGMSMRSATWFATAFLRSILLGCLGMVGVGFAACASANLISPVVIIDNALVFSGTVDITQFSVATYSFTSSNWRVDVIEDFIGSEANPNDFQITVQHLVAPSASEPAPNPFVLQSLIFANSFTPGGPARGPFFASVPHGVEFDFLQTSYVPLGTSSSRVVIVANHGDAPLRVSEPASLYLLAIGAFVLIAQSRARCLLVSTVARRAWG